MLNWIKFAWKRWKIERWKDSNSRAQERAEKKARAKGATRDALYQVRSEYDVERMLADDEMIRLTSSYYVRLADRMLIPVPGIDDIDSTYWAESQQVPGHYHLTPKALHELRTTIGAEQKARREAWTVWLSLVIGVIGGLSGLISIIRK